MIKPSIKSLMKEYNWTPYKDLKATEREMESEEAYTRRFTDRLSELGWEGFDNIEEGDRKNHIRRSNQEYDQRVEDERNEHRFKGKSNKQSILLGPSSASGASTTSPKAVPMMVRGEDGRMRTVYQDVTTGATVPYSELSNYEIVSVGDDVPGEGTSPSDKSDSKSKSDKSGSFGSNGPSTRASRKESDRKGSEDGKRPSGSTGDFKSEYIDKPGWFGLASAIPGPVGWVGRAVNTGINMNNVSAVNRERKEKGLPPLSLGQSIKGALFGQKRDETAETEETASKSPIERLTGLKEGFVGDFLDNMFARDPNSETAKTISRETGLPPQQVAELARTPGALSQVRANAIAASPFPGKTKDDLGITTGINNRSLGIAGNLGAAAGKIDYSNIGPNRSRKVSPEMEGYLKGVASSVLGKNVEVSVTSGDVDPTDAGWTADNNKYSKSHRHTDNLGADVQITDPATGQSVTDPVAFHDLAINAAAMNPDVGIGFGEDYMGNMTMHLDLSGRPGIWGGGFTKAQMDTINGARRTGIGATPYRGAPIPTPNPGPPPQSLAPDRQMPSGPVRESLGTPTSLAPDRPMPSGPVTSNEAYSTPGGYTPPGPPSYSTPGGYTPPGPPQSVTGRTPSHPSNLPSSASVPTRNPGSLPDQVSALPSRNPGSLPDRVGFVPSSNPRGLPSSVSTLPSRSPGNLPDSVGTVPSGRPFTGTPGVSISGMMAASPSATHAFGEPEATPGLRSAIDAVGKSLSPTATRSVLSGVGSPDDSYSKGLVARSVAPSNNRFAGVDLSKATPAQFAALGLTQRTVEQRGLISKAIAGELGPTQLSALKAGDPVARQEVANMVASIENRMESKMFSPNLNSVLDPSQYNSLMASKLDTTNNNFSLYGDVVSAAVNDVYAGVNNPSEWGIGAYHATNMKNPPSWSGLMTDVSVTGQHKFGSLPEYGADAGFRARREAMAAAQVSDTRGFTPSQNYSGGGYSSSPSRNSPSESGSRFGGSGLGSPSYAGRSGGLNSPSEGGSRFGGSGLGYSGRGGYSSPSEGGSRFGGSGLGSPSRSSYSGSSGPSTRSSPSASRGGSTYGGSSGPSTRSSPSASRSTYSGSSGPSTRSSPSTSSGLGRTSSGTSNGWGGRSGSV